MSESMNQQILLKSYPTGAPQESDFALVETAIPELGDKEVLNRTVYLSLDPYMRGRMSDRESYATPAELGRVMMGSTVSQVVKSKHPQFSEGEFVVGYDGWQAYGISKGESLIKLDPKQVPISYALGITGMPGMTAYFSLLDMALLHQYSRSLIEQGFLISDIY